MRQATPAPSPVEIRSVTFRWNRHQAPCLEVDRLDIAAGQRTLIHGPSGSGKSTLLGLLGGVLVPESGTVRVLGTDLGSMTATQRDRFRVAHIGFIFQQFNLIPYLNATQNVLLPCRFSRRRAQRAVQGTGLDVTTRAGELLESIGITGALRHRPVAELSVGQQQRVAAARALIGRPELILADEPTSALDADAQQVFLDLLLEQCAESGAALLFVTHDRQLASRFDCQVALASINDGAAIDNASAIKNGAVIDNAAAIKNGAAIDDAAA